MKVTLVGVKAVVDFMGSYEKDVTTEIRNAINTSAINIDREAKLKVPVDTGRLRSSIHPVPTSTFDAETQLKSGELEAYVATNVEYAEHVEQGYGQPAQPYLFPAYESERPELVKRIEGVLRERR